MLLESGVLFLPVLDELSLYVCALLTLQGQLTHFLLLLQDLCLCFIHNLVQFLDLFIVLVLVVNGCLLICIQLFLMLILEELRLCLLLGNDLLFEFYECLNLLYLFL